MSVTTLVAIISIFFEVVPLTCHRLITNPYPEQEWDSVIVSSDPITIREKAHNNTTPLKLNEILKPQKRSYEECPQNDFACLYGNQENKNSNPIVDKFLEQYSLIADDKFTDDRSLTEGKEKENSRKSYWAMVDSQIHNHPYDDKKGWVSLEPVPWSTSQVSKWHPNKVGIQQESKPWGYESTTQRPVQQFWVAGSNYHPQRPNSYWGIGTNDIITDNKPNDFPVGQYHAYQNPNYHPHNGVYGNAGHYNQFHHAAFTSKYPQGTHPSTYPSNGNGEWVLLSTTKGFSHPQRHRWTEDHKKIDRVSSMRKIKPLEISKYQEGDLDEKFTLGDDGYNKSGPNEVEDTGKSNSTRHESSEKAPIQILYTGAPKEGIPVKAVRRKVRLQVLPSLESSSTSYGGLLEVNSNSQTVDEAQQEDEKMKRLKGIANVKKNKFRGFKLVPTSKVNGKGMSQKNIMTLAAVGAGMIPATMALLVPMALGRKKRNVSFSYPELERTPRSGEIRKFQRMFQNSTGTLRQNLSMQFHHPRLLFKHSRNVK